MITTYTRRAAMWMALPLFVPASGFLRAQGPPAVPDRSGAFEIPTDHLIQADELNRDLHASGSKRPLVLQVGSRVLFEQAHISDSEYAGPGSQEEGIKALQIRAASIPRNRFVVLYCGCCPWNRCPNVEPAYKALESMGFAQVKVLYIEQNFGADWVQKGYPVDRGH